MILIRSAVPTDAKGLLALSGTPGLFNIPEDPGEMNRRIALSVDSFQGKVRKFSDNKFIFVAEDLENRRIIGTSMMSSQHGTPDSPHFFFQVQQEKRYSESIKSGFIHTTLRLKTDSEGPTELGGLVVDPAYRGHEARVGKQLSLARFFFLGLFPERFRNRILAELLPPLNKKGQAPLWEAIGRRFTNIDYWEADQLARQDKEFIMSLFPKERIYTALFSAEARNSIGKISKGSEPACRMLVKLGFHYLQQVDPFDGGPHYGAQVSEIQSLKKIKRGKLDFKESNKDEAGGAFGLLAVARKNQPFSAVVVRGDVSGNRMRLISPAKEALRALRATPTDEFAFFPMDLEEPRNGR